MLKHSLYFLIFVTLLLAASGCARLENLQVQLNEEFSLSIGQRAFIEEEKVEVGFIQVVEDSRCPTGVTCIWAGRIICEIELTLAGSSHRLTLNEPGLTNEYSREKYEGYELTFHVTPYPEEGKKISTNAYRLHLIINKPEETIARVIGSIIAEPSTFEGQDVTVIGYYRGWDLLQEANTAPPITRSDWVIKDSTGAIYVSAASEAEVPEELSPSSLEDSGTILEVRGIVRVTDWGQPYIEATSIERIP